MTVWRQSQAKSDALRQWLAELRATGLVSARLHGSIELAFLDTRPLYGMILETGYGRSDSQVLEATYPRATR
jgi:hypothetical protein